MSHPTPRPSPEEWLRFVESKGRRLPTTPSSATRYSETSRTSSGTSQVRGTASHPTTARRACRKASARGEVPLRAKVPRGTFALFGDCLKSLDKVDSTGGLHRGTLI